MGPFKCYKGDIQVLRNADGVEGEPNFPGKSVTMVYVSPLLALQGGGSGRFRGGPGPPFGKVKKCKRA